MTRAEISARSTAMCRHYQKHGDIGAAARKFGVERSAIWKVLRRRGVVPAYAAKGSAAIAPLTPPVFEIVDRDPCPRCGVRGDLACGHSRAPVTVRVSA